MRKEEWEDFTYFHPQEAWGNPEKIDYWLVVELEGLRKFIGKPIIIHCGTQGKHTPNSYHYAGLAVDCHTEGISLLEFYLASERFNFGGIGIYPWWNNPGLHLDIRPVWPGKPRSRWGCIERGKYIPFDKDFLKSLIRRRKGKKHG